MYFFFSFSLFFALYNSTQNMDEFLRMKLDVSKALQSNFHISHNATCFFQKKNFAKPFFYFVIRRVRENFLTKMNVLAIKEQVLYYINADK